MLPFEEKFLDAATLTDNWIVAPAMSVRNGTLLFAPDPDEGFCAGVTRRNDFSNFSLPDAPEVTSARPRCRESETVSHQGP